MINDLFLTLLQEEHLKIKGNKVNDVERKIESLSFKKLHLIQNAYKSLFCCIHFSTNKFLCFMFDLHIFFFFRQIHLLIRNYKRKSSGCNFLFRKWDKLILITLNDLMLRHYKVPLRNIYSHWNRHRKSSLYFISQNSSTTIHLWFRDVKIPTPRLLL